MSCVEVLASLEDVRSRVEHFVNEREWNQFHTPRNVALGMVCISMIISATLVQLNNLIVMNKHCLGSVESFAKYFNGLEVMIDACILSRNFMLTRMLCAKQIRPMIFGI